jgi:hypothetical protein
VQHTGGVKCGDVTMDKRSMQRGGWWLTMRGELWRGQLLVQEFDQGEKREVGSLLCQPGPDDAGRADHCLATRWKIKAGEGRVG